MNRTTYIEFIEEIERNYKVSDVRVNGINIWPVLRNKYWGYYRKAEAEKEFREKKKKRRGKGNTFYGIVDLFRKYDYAVFSDIGNRKDIDGYQEDRFAEPLIKRIGYDRTLFVESTGNSHFDRSRLRLRHIISYELFDALSAKFRKYDSKILTAENFNVLDDINSAYGLKINYIERIKGFLAHYNIMRLFFRIYRPRAVFVVCYYSYFDVIKAAKDSGIKVIEIQHGVIGTAHPAYNITIELDSSFFPDYFLAFGKNDVRFLKGTRFITPQNIIPIGSFYIEYMREKKVDIKEIDSVSSNYKKIVGVTSQSLIETKLIDFLLAAAARDKRILYIFISRDRKKKDYDVYNFPENIMIAEGFNFYEIMQYADFHATAFSTCAIEAPSLGVSNILIDIDGFARKYYSTILADEEITRYVETPEEFVAAVNAGSKPDRKYIMKSNEHIFQPDYNKNADKFIASLV